MSAYDMVSYIEATNTHILSLFFFFVIRFWNENSDH